MNDYDEQFEWFSFLDYYRLTPPRNDLSRENAVDVKNVRKVDKIYPKRLSCTLFSLNSNFKTLEACLIIRNTKHLLGKRN